MCRVAMDARSECEEVLSMSLLPSEMGRRGKVNRKSFQKRELGRSDRAPCQRTHVEMLRSSVISLQEVRRACRLTVMMGM